MGILDTGVKNVANVPRYTIGSGSIQELERILHARRSQAKGPVIALVDEFFSEYKTNPAHLNLTKDDHVCVVSTTHEPTTDGVDAIFDNLKSHGITSPSA